jgi:hypothetical protein
MALSWNQLESAYPSEAQMVAFKHQGSRVTVPRHRSLNIGYMGEDYAGDYAGDGELEDPYC